ncbi:MAG TPA: carotenoid oxygenase family protein [Pyrinomonadaceae bacterium]|jgi:all-trans-8'-apo-beta-carotenal 15,15'-oxygenase|nr:carotenoid oxygenase family protein [Pyrinomonadaceae bacterium]
MRDYAPGIERAFARAPVEVADAPCRVEGRLPDYLRGTYYINGPARFERGGFRYRHWLDGDGMVCALRFEGGRVRATSRFVRSEKFLTEEEAGRPVFRAFGTSFESDLLKRRVALESPVNVSVYSYGDSLLAFGEQGLPYALDPASLETRGEFNFGGALNDVSPFAAHPKMDAETGELFNFGVAFSETAPTLNLYRFGPRAELVYRSRLPLERASTVHDFGLSPSYAVFYLSPYVLDMRRFVAEGHTLMESLRWEQGVESVLLVVSRETGEQVASFPVGQRYCLHFVNCFEREGLLSVDVIELERPVYDQYQTVPNLFTDVCEGRPVRYVVNVSRREPVARKEIDYRFAPDFPSIDPRLAAREYEDFWMLGISATGSCGRKFFDRLVHASWDGRPPDVYQPPPLQYLCGEPVFVGDPSGERAGSVVCQLFDAGRVASAFAVFDAFHVARGPVALLGLKEPIHLGFHASFNPS